MLDSKYKRGFIDRNGKRETCGKKFLVTGSSGFIGSNVVENLKRNELQFSSLDLICPNSNGTANFLYANILDLPAIERVLFENDYEAIIHLIGLPHISSCEENPRLSFQLNVLSVQNILEAMRKNDVKKIVFASSAAVYGNSCLTPIKETDSLKPNTIYGYHKLIAEKLIQSYCTSYGLSHVILRLFNVYGGNPYSGKDVISIFIKNALRGEPIQVKGAQKFRDFVHIDNVAEFFVKAASDNISNKVVNIGTGEALTLHEIAEITKKAFPNLTAIYEDTEDNGTGLLADTNLLHHLFSFPLRDPREGILAHVIDYSK